jgi:hypothetical protein
MNGESALQGVTFYVGNEPTGQIWPNKDEPGTAFAGIVDKRGEREAAAVVYLANSPGNFVYLIPALKKIDGVSQMIRIPLAESSALVSKSKATPPSREVIQLKRRAAITAEAYPGRFQVPSPRNLILFHDSNPKRDLCTLELYPAGFYTLEIGYPLSPLQGFLAAIIAVLP